MHRKLKELLDVECFVTVKHLGKNVGMCKFSNRHIWIDLAQDENIVKTFIHELLHLRHPSWTERKILFWERMLWQFVDHSVAELFYQKFYRDIHKGYTREN